MRFRFRHFDNASPPGQLGAVWVAPGQSHFAINQDQRQRLLTGAFQEGFNRFILGENQRLLRQIETLDLSPVLLAQSTSAEKLTSA